LCVIVAHNLVKPMLLRAHNDKGAHVIVSRPRGWGERGTHCRAARELTGWGELAADCGCNARPPPPNVWAVARLRLVRAIGCATQYVEFWQ